MLGGEPPPPPLIFADNTALIPITRALCLRSLTFTFRLFRSRDCADSRRLLLSLLLLSSSLLRAGLVSPSISIRSFLTGHAISFLFSSPTHVHRGDAFFIPLPEGNGTFLVSFFFLSLSLSLSLASPFQSRSAKSSSNSIPFPSCSRVRIHTRYVQSL